METSSKEKNSLKLLPIKSNQQNESESIYPSIFDLFSDNFPDFYDLLFDKEIQLSALNIKEMNLNENFQTTLVDKRKETNFIISNETYSSDMNSQIISKRIEKKSNKFTYSNQEHNKVLINFAKLIGCFLKKGKIQKEIVDFYIFCYPKGNADCNGIVSSKKKIIRLNKKNLLHVIAAWMKRDGIENLKAKYINFKQIKSY
jgi:hypothetical protein